MQFYGTVLYVENVEAAIEFYCRTFHFTVRYHDRELGFVELETGASTLALASHSVGEMLMPGTYRRSSDGRTCGVEIAFLTTDVPSLYQKVIAGGATSLAAPKKMPWGLEVAYLQAPDGTMIALSEPPPK
jgi:uncharacterized glyoxalase superfamily protein PhnB